MADEKISRCGDLDERLAPYVDGEASPDARRAVDAHLSACPPCRERYEAERTAREILHGSRDQLRPAAPGALRARCAASCRPVVVRRPGGLRRWVPLSLAASLLLAVAGVFLFSAADHVQAFADGLALDHVKCFKVGETHAAVDASTWSTRWEQRQGWPLAVPASAPAKNLRLLTVRRCLSTDGWSAHLMYVWNGDPLSVYVLPRVVSADRLLDALGHQAVIWSANGRTYAVLAEGHPAGLDQMVNYVKANAK
ncbi:MAG: hypothetical protein DMF85_04835 [Acidobacteria bacterium]|nr:MAG: hypothetical protein DMF85_04835 [Acidobacteriota bacterium]